MKTPGENPTTFEEFIELNKPMTPLEATEKLAAFHDTSNEAILAAFRNLRDFQGQSGTVQFRRTVNSGYPCIAMNGNTPEGKYAWSELIDRHNGQPQARCG